MNYVMEFPETVEEFMESYKMTDTEHIYSNGIEYVPIFRMKQWFEHIKGGEEKRAGWIKTSERLPELNEDVLAFLEDEKRIYIGFMNTFDEWRLYDYSEQSWGITHEAEDIPYWMPLPELPEVEE